MAFAATRVDAEQGRCVQSGPIAAVIDNAPPARLRWKLRRLPRSGRLAKFSCAGQRLIPILPYRIKSAKAKDRGNLCGRSIITDFKLTCGQRAFAILKIRG